MPLRSVSLVTLAVLTMSASVAHSTGTQDHAIGTRTVGEDATATRVEPGDSPRAAVVTSPLQAAVDAAAPGDTVLVAPGVYVGVLTFRGKNVTVRSTGGPDVTSIEGFGTTANGPLVDIGPGGALIDFTITKGRAVSGGGMAVHGAGSVIEGNIFRENGSPSYGSGAAIFGNSASPLIEGNTFRNNACDGATGGIVRFHNSSSPTIVNNVFEDNACAAISLVIPVGQSPVVINNTIVRNALGLYLSRNVNTNLVIFENNAIVANGKGLRTDGGTEAFNPTWKNNLLFGNTVDYTGISDQTGQNGNIAADPQFIDLTGGDYHVGLGSPAIDAGDSNAPRLPSTDYDGEVRIRDGSGDSVAVIDIGADEYTWRNRKPVASPGPDQTLACQDAPTVAVALDGSASTDPDSTLGTNDDIVAFDWFEGFGTPPQSLIGSGEHAQVSLSGGTHRVTLRVTDQGGLVGTAAITIDVRGRSDCDDGNSCTEDSVTPACGCSHVPTPESMCDDGNACTSFGVCNAAGTCIGAAPISCADWNPCTQDSCDPVTGCVHTGFNGPCDDHNPCTESDTCASSMCRGIPVGDGKLCDDQNDCTRNESCSAGYCRGTEVDDGTSCDDKNPCTDNDACRWGWCSGGTAVPDGTMCGDPDPCTVGERCRQGTCTGAVPFVQPTGSPFAATSPLTTGDFNGDGKVDIVAASASSVSTLLVLLGNGAGGFVQASTVPLASNAYPSLIVVADFNRDGRTDIAAKRSEGENNTVGVFFGNGAGGFAPDSGSTPELGSMVSGLLTADFNHDGNHDLAVARHTGSVTILLGNGSGGFVAHGSFAGGGYPEALAMGDFNEDGNADLAVGTAGTTGGVVIALGDGAGGFTAGASIPTGGGPSSIAVGDLDQDGDLDLALANGGWGSSQFAVLHGNGHGQFGSLYTFSADGESYSVIATDLDLDGALDLVFGFGDHPSVSVFLGSTPGYFAPAFGSPVSLSGDFTDLASADFDGDGRPDLAVSSLLTYEVRILLNRSAGMACPKSHGCTTNVCDRSTGQCAPVPKFLGSACDDRSVCTTNDSCTASGCDGAAVIGLACDDGNACTLGDTCGGGVCFGMSVPAPQEVDSGVRVSRSGPDATVSWNVAAGATASSVLRGSLRSLPVGSMPGDETCLASGLPVPAASTIDAQLPQAGSGFWYLIRASNACGNGGYGSAASHGVPAAPRSSGTCP